MQKSIFWYDYETTGINPRADRALQVAGVRTDESLNIIDEPVNLYAQLSDDILPNPRACLITGITPQLLAEKGLPEAQFMAQVHAQLSRPGTCGAGYNSLRFDDEVTRYSLYRNFYDPYAREWQGGNSRWDLIDVVRTAYALRPEGVVWPQEQGRVSLKLEGLTSANGLTHAKAHDALSDVYATIALAQRIRECQPKLYAYLYAQRSKAAIASRIELLKPMVHVSGQFGAERHYLAPVLPLAWHPSNRNALIVADLSKELSPLYKESAAVLQKRLYTPSKDLQGELPVPLKLVHLNRCPVLLPLNIVRAADELRLGWDGSLIYSKVSELIAYQDIWQPKIKELYQSEFALANEDPEQQLYDGFIVPADRLLCDKVRNANPERLADYTSAFSDKRLPELLFRYRARNYPATLSTDEQLRWQHFCQQRLEAPCAGAPLTAEGFFRECEAIVKEGQLSQQHELLQGWQRHVKHLLQKYALSN